MHNSSSARRALLLGLILAWPGLAHAQLAPSGASSRPPASAPPVEVVVARFLVDIDGLESGFPDEQKAGGLLPTALRARENVQLAREAVATLRTPDGTPVKLAIDSLYAIVAEEVSALGLTVLSSDTLRGTVPYLLGYPMGSARSVVGEETYKRAIEVEIDVAVPDQGTGYWAVLGTGRAVTKGRPEMELRIRYLDADGTAWREKVRVRSRERVELAEAWLLGVQRKQDVSDASSLFGLTREAARRVVQKQFKTAIHDRGA